jgi:ABC-type polysaccharide/polyol phosphate export permease
MPSVVAELLRYSPLVKNLVFKDLKLKYRDSVLGVVWSLLNPLLMLGVYTLAFKFILRVQTENYAYFLLVGLLPWNFFSSSLIASTQAIAGNGHLIRKVYFPRETLPIATVLFTFSQLLLALAVSA